MLKSVLFQVIFLLFITVGSAYCKIYDAKGKVVDNASGGYVRSALVLISYKAEFKDMDTVYTESDGTFFLKNIFVADTASVVYAVASQVGFKPGVSSKIMFFVRDTIDFGTIRLDSTKYDTIIVSGVVMDTLHASEPIPGAKVGVADISSFANLISLRGGFAGGFYNDTITTDYNGRFEMKNFLVVSGNKYGVVYGATGNMIENYDSLYSDTVFKADSVFLTIKTALKMPKIITSDIKFSGELKNADQMEVYTLSGRKIYAGKSINLNSLDLNEGVASQQLIVSFFKNGRAILSGRKVMIISGSR